MTLKQLINETFSLNEEEELERKLLALRSEKALKILDDTILKFEQKHGH